MLVKGKLLRRNRIHLRPYDVAEFDPAPEARRSPVPTVLSPPVAPRRSPRFAQQPGP